MRSAAATPAARLLKKWLQKAFLGSSTVCAYANTPVAISTMSGYSLRRSRSASAPFALTAYSSIRTSGRFARARSS